MGCQLKHAVEPPPASPFLSVPQAAKQMQCSPGLLYRLIRDGDFPAIQLGAKKYLVPTKVVEELVEVVIETGGLVNVADWAKMPSNPVRPGTPTSR